MCHLQQQPMDLFRELLNPRVWRLLLGTGVGCKHILIQGTPVWLQCACSRS